MGEIKAGVVVVTEFCRPHTSKFQGYIDYINRTEAVRNENTAKYNLYQDYMGNPEKTTALFTAEKDELTKEDKYELKEIFDKAQENESIMWQTVISFDNRWLKQNGIINESDSLIDEAGLKNAARGGIRRMLENENLENAIWSAAIHFNTDNIHIHVATVEPVPMREKKEYVQYNYRYENGQEIVFSDMLPDRKLLSDIHRICFDIHMELLEKYGMNTDIVFSRPNYCKIDLMVENQRGDNLFMQGNELDLLKDCLKKHGVEGGLQGLLDISEAAGARYGITVKPTCDAKYLEVGISSKSDNVDRILEYLEEKEGISPQECSFWGDEYVGIEEGIYGSDSFMKTEKTAAGEFFDVSQVPGKRPEGVVQLGGGVERFLEFLKEQAQIE